MPKKYRKYVRLALFIFLSVLAITMSFIYGGTLAGILMSVIVAIISFLIWLLWDFKFKLNW